MLLFSTPALYPQNTNYPALRTLYDTYKADGFNLVAFPCNQFGGQAPGSSEEERAWAFKKFGFEFDVFVSTDLCHSRCLSGWVGGSTGIKQV
jgi:glutathione peroxidase-family protein